MPAEPSDVPLYNTAAVVQRTGVPAATFRAWERRYGFPKPERDAAGQRLYSERDMRAIRWLSDQTARGVAISRAVDMLRHGYAQPAPADPPRPAGRTFEALCRELLEALLAFAAGHAESVLAEAFALFSVEEVCLHVLQPLMAEVGERWHAGDVSVAEEHFVTSFVRTRLFALMHAYQREGVGPLVFTTCAPGEWHEVGILLVTLFLARRGYQVRYLGPNLPLAALGNLLRHHHPAAVVVSAQSAETAQALLDLPALLDRLPPPRPRLAVGGQAFNEHGALRSAVDGSYVGPDAEAAVAALDRLLRSA